MIVSPVLYLMKDEMLIRFTCCFEFQAYLKPHFNYNPNTDNLIPCKEAGLAFSKGDILQVVNKEDSNWWQVSTCRFSLLSVKSLNSHFDLHRHAKSSVEPLASSPVSSWRRRGRLSLKETWIILVQVCIN